MAGKLFLDDVTGPARKASAIVNHKVLTFPDDARERAHRGGIPLHLLAGTLPLLAMNSGARLAEDSVSNVNVAAIPVSV